jgi:O-acetyl-ADP-ribose deacetylase (regulator of RNase III)
MAHRPLQPYIKCIPMATIHYLKGDATVPQAAGTKIIAHICNNIGGWGKGFVLAISKRWTSPEESFRAWHRDRAHNDFALGSIQLVQVGSYIHIANMIGQQGLKSGSDGPPIRYEAVADCLGKLALAAQAMGASVHMPRIGTGLAGGKWERIEPLILETLIAAGVQVYVYDFE